MIFVGKKNSTSFFLLISPILGLALYTALFSSCVYEDLSKCSRMFMLQPRYLLHTGEGDRFGEAVQHLSQNVSGQRSTFEEWLPDAY